MMDCARDTSRRLCWDQVEDEWIDVTGCVGPATPTLPFSMYYVLGA
jgi:hypothetical protein